jgi:hypothetical protein
MSTKSRYTVANSTSEIEFTERDLRIMENCKDYYDGDPAGLPGHNLMMIIGKLMHEYAIMEDMVELPGAHMIDG